MYNDISMGPTPLEESCQQVGTPTYNAEEAHAECYRYIAALRAKMGVEPEGAQLRITYNSCDFDTYLDVVCRYDEECPDACDYAFACESHGPQTWQDLVPYEWRNKR